MSKIRRATKEEISQVLRRGHRLDSPLFTLRITSLPKGPSAVAVVVSKRVARQAVVRNTLERRGRELLRKGLQGATPRLVLLEWRKGAAEAPRQAIAREFAEKLQQDTITR